MSPGRARSATASSGRRRPREVVMPMPLSGAILGGYGPGGVAREQEWTGSPPHPPPPPAGNAGTRPRSPLDWLKNRFNRSFSSPPAPPIQVESPVSYSSIIHP